MKAKRTQQCLNTVLWIFCSSFTLNSWRLENNPTVYRWMNRWTHLVYPYDKFSSALKQYGWIVKEVCWIKEGRHTMEVNLHRLSGHVLKAGQWLPDREEEEDRCQKGKGREGGGREGKGGAGFWRSGKTSGKLMSCVTTWVACTWLWFPTPASCHRRPWEAGGHFGDLDCISGSWLWPWLSLSGSGHLGRETAHRDSLSLK